MPLAADADKTVQLVLARVLPALHSVRVQVFLGQGLDFSGAREGLAGVAPLHPRKAAATIRPCASTWQRDRSGGPLQCSRS